MASEGLVTQGRNEELLPMPGVISEDLTEKGRRGLVYMSQIEVCCCCCFCLSETGAVGLFPALLRSPLPCVPLPSETPKRASEHLFTAPTSEGKHLGTEGETVPDKHTAPTQILLQEGKHPSSHSKRRHVRNHFYTATNFYEIIRGKSFKYRCTFREYQL